MRGGFCIFTTVILEDVLIIYYDDHSRHDVMYADHDSNEIVRRLLRLYY